MPRCLGFVGVVPCIHACSGDPESRSDRWEGSLGVVRRSRKPQRPKERGDAGAGSGAREKVAGGRGWKRSPGEDLGACLGGGDGNVGGVTRFSTLNSCAASLAKLLTGTMSTVVAQSLHVFGLRSHVSNNVFFFDEQIIIFPSGNHCVKYNVDQKWQKFIPGKTLSNLTHNRVCQI